MIIYYKIKKCDTFICIIKHVKNYNSFKMNEINILIIVSKWMK